MSNHRDQSAAEQIAGMLSRIERLERQIAALSDPQPPQAADTPIRITDVKAAVCRYYGFTAADLEGWSRFGPLQHARQAGIYLARELTGKSLPAIGRLFGNRSHTAVMYVHRNVARLRAVDADLDEELRVITDHLRPSGGRNDPPNDPENPQPSAPPGEAEADAAGALSATQQ
jgi:chromosomal replication initiation ATPase DnaA